MEKTVALRDLTGYIAGDLHAYLGARESDLNLEIYIEHIAGTTVLTGWYPLRDVVESEIRDDILWVTFHHTDNGEMTLANVAHPFPADAEIRIR